MAHNNTTRNRRRIVVTIAVAMLLLAEGFVRLRSSVLPLPQNWTGPEASLKQAQIERLQDHGGASIVFLGSSVVDVAVDASAMKPTTDGRPAYNAATGAASLEMIDVWGRLFAVPKLEPDVVVVGLVSRELNANDPEQAKNQAAFFASREVRHLTGKDDLIDSAEWSAEDLSELFRYRTVLRDPNNVERLFGLGTSDTGRTFGDIVADDGQYEGLLDNHYVASKQSDAAVRDRALHAFTIGDGQVAALGRLLRYLHDRVRHVVVVNMPVTSRYVMLHPHGQADYDAATEIISREAAAAGATFIDERVWDNQFFGDPIHLNRTGAARLTATIDDAVHTLV